MPRRKKTILLLIALALIVAIGLGVWKRREIQDGVWRISLRSSTIALPRCDRVEVYHLDPYADVDAGFPNRPHNTFIKVLEQRTLKGRQAEELTELWRSQTFAERPGQYQALCHDPVFGLKFYRGSVLKFETTVCFDCGNFSLTAWGKSGYWGFDVGTKEAAGLLETLLNLFPNTVTSEEHKFLEVLKEFLAEQE